MAIVTKQVVVCQQLDTILQIVVGIVSDVMQKKSPATVVSDAVPTLVSSLSGLAQLGDEIKNVPAVDYTIALKLVQLKEVLLPTAAV